jgi:putative ABC transport system permease protein
VHCSGTDILDSYVFKVDTSKNMSAVITKVKAFLAENLSEMVGEYTVENGNSDMAKSNEETASLSAVLGGVAAIALLVGGIGIMNIMLVTVTERTREIGIKKAIGAPRREIIIQFLVESGVLSGMGGLIGVALGYLLSLILGKALYDLIILPEVWMSAAAFAFSIAIGVGFGLYPAVKASALQPVEALRAE